MDAQLAKMFGGRPGAPKGAPQDAPGAPEPGADDTGSADSQNAVVKTITITEKADGTFSMESDGGDQVAAPQDFPDSAGLMDALKAELGGPEAAPEGPEAPGGSQEQPGGAPDIRGMMSRMMAGNQNQGA
jgi:hypothetical protein